jgi:hypothetical protein
MFVEVFIFNTPQSSIKFKGISSRKRSFLRLSEYLIFKGINEKHGRDIAIMKENKTESFILFGKNVVKSVNKLLIEKGAKKKKKNKQTNRPNQTKPPKDYRSNWLFTLKRFH